MQLRNSKWLFFICSGLLLAVAMSYPQTMWWCGYIYLLPILYFLYTRKNEKLSTLFFLFFLFSLTFSIISTFWFVGTYPLSWMNVQSSFISMFMIGVIWVLFSFSLSIATACWVVVESYVKIHCFFVKACLMSFAWVGVEYLRSWVMAVGLYGDGSLFAPHHTYYSLGYLASVVPFVKNLLPVGGIYLVSFVTIAINYMVFGCVLLLWKKEKIYKDILALCLLIGALLSVSFWYMLDLHSSNREKDKNQTVMVTVFNTQLPSSINKEIDNKKTETVFQGMKLVQNKDEVLIFPENINVLSSFYASTTTPVPERLRNAGLVIGSYSTVTKHPLFYFSPTTKQLDVYYKQLLMPVAEYDSVWLTLLFKLMYLFGLNEVHTNPKEPTEIRGVTVFKKTENIIFFGAICSENISPYIYRNAVLGGATVLVNVTSHAPFRDSMLLTRQTIAINTVRALESGRYFITASNHEPSFVVSDTGEMVRSISSVLMGEFSLNIPVRTHKTPYVLYGDYTVVISYMSLFLYFLWFYKRTS